MFHLNLLPWRKRQRQRIKKIFSYQLTFSTIGSLVVVFSLHMFLSQHIAQQQIRNHRLTIYIAQYKKPLFKLKQIKTKHERFIKYLQIFLQFRRQRIRNINIFNTIINIISDDIYFTSIKRKATHLTLKGFIMNNIEITQLLNNIKKIPWLKQTNLKITRNRQNFVYPYRFELGLIEN